MPAPIIDRLDHLVLTVADLDATVGFYRDALGMAPERFGAADGGGSTGAGDGGAGGSDGGDGDGGSAGNGLRGGGGGGEGHAYRSAPFVQAPEVP